MLRKSRILIVLLVTLGILVLIGILAIPSLSERVAWYLKTIQVKIERMIDPPEREVFVPQQSGVIIEPKPSASPSQARQPTQTPASTQAIATGTPLPTGTLSPTATPPPPAVQLAAVKHEYQQFNNCGPATLAMALSYWGWQGDQRLTRQFLRPSFAKVDDKNVNPAEMVDFIESETDLEGLARVGGDLELLQRLLAAGFPVMVEVGIQHQPRDWMGHYLLISGYDTQKGRLITQDALVGPDLPVKYDEFEQGWRAFNQAFIVAYSPNRQEELFSILGPQADPRENLRLAAAKASEEVMQPGANGLGERDQFFSWYNLGSSLTALGDYPAAASAFDQAFAIYASIAEVDRPWRVLWYRSEPLEAFYQMGRMQDVLTLGNQALDSAGGPLLEESFYWLGRARQDLGDMEKAVYDYCQAVNINPHSTPAQSELERLGAECP